MFNSVNSVLQFGFGGWETNPNPDPNPNPPKNMNQNIKKEEEEDEDEDDFFKWMFQREFLFYICRNRNIHIATLRDEIIQMRGLHKEIDSLNYSNTFAYVIHMLCLHFMRGIREEKKGSSCSLRSVKLCFFIWWIKGIHITSCRKRITRVESPNKEPPTNTLSVNVLDLLPKEIIEVEFVMRLSVKTLMRLKCVSKYWNNFISDDNFRRRYRSRQKNSGNAPTGLFMSDKFDPYAVKHSFCAANKFLYMSENHVKKELESFDYLNTFGYIIAASNGLLLLGHNPKSLYVYDLVSKKHINIPRNNTLGDAIGLGFKFEERSISSKSHQHLFSFKMVCVDVQSQCLYKRMGSSYNVEIYSSESGTWRTTTMRSEFSFDLQSPSVSRVFGGVFHWHHRCVYRVIAYDDDFGTCGRVVIIGLPFREVKILEKTLMHFEVMKDGSLQFISIKDKVINVWIMNRTIGVSYLDEKYISGHRWTLASSVSLSDIIGVSLSDFGLFQQNCSRYICTDAVNHHIVYLIIADQLYAYDHCQQKIVFTFSQKIELRKNVFVPFDWESDVFVHFEWPTWPCL